MAPEARPQTTPPTDPSADFSRPRRIMIVEDDERARSQLGRLLSADPNYEVFTAGDGGEALELLGRGHVSVVITDLRMPGRDGLDLMSEIRRRGLPLSVIVTTGADGAADAVRAMRLGAYDYLTKPFDVEQLRQVLRHALREQFLRDELALLKEQLQTHYNFYGILSKSSKMRAIFELVAGVAASSATVLIEGETGTGKEQLARTVHLASGRRWQPFVPVSCAAIPEGVLDSELFGHEKGSFTSAVSQRKGRFEMADGGTLFLDEIGDVTPMMQARLLRVLQERAFERVGGSDLISVDVRIVAATNRNLRRLVKRKRFRRDLYYRLNVVRIELPPLRERKEDVPLLATHFAEKYSPKGSPRRIGAAAMEVLLGYNWPGNIRELENAIECACVTTRGDEIGPGNLPPQVAEPARLDASFPVDTSRPLPELLHEMTSQVERQYLREVLQKTRGNVGLTAQVSGMSRRSISSKIAEYKIDRSEFQARG